MWGLGGCVGGCGFGGLPSLHTAKTVNVELCFGPRGKHAFVYQHAHFTHIILHCNAK